MKENIKIVNKLEESTGPFKLLEGGKPFLLQGLIYIKLQEALASSKDNCLLYNTFDIQTKTNCKVEADTEVREVCISVYITK